MRVLLTRYTQSGSRGSCRIGLVRLGVPEYSRYTSVCEIISTVEERLRAPKSPLSPNVPESLWSRFPHQIGNRIRDKKKRNTGESGASGESWGVTTGELLHHSIQKADSLR